MTQNPPGVPLGLDSERHASELELFFDLVFVVAVGALATLLEQDPSLVGTLRFAFTFAVVGWIWIGFTFFADRFDGGNQRIHRVLMIGAMLAVLAMSVAIPSAFAGGAASARFAIAVAVVRSVLLVLYVRTHIREPSARPLTGRYIAGFAVGIAVWLTSVLLPDDLRYAAWAVALAVELATPLVSAGAIRRVPFHRTHIPERFSLFVIIVLGEVIALGALSLGARDATLASLSVGAVGFVVAAGLWWVYFESVDGSSMGRWLISGQTYVYGHLIVFASLTAFGVGVRLATEASVIDSAPELSAAARALLCGGVGAFVIALGAIEGAKRFPRRSPRALLQIAIGVAMIALIWIAREAPLLVVEAILLVPIVAQILVDAAARRGDPNVDAIDS